METLKKQHGDGTIHNETDEISKAEARARRKEAKKNNKGKSNVKCNEVKSTRVSEEEKKLETKPAVNNGKGSKTKVVVKQLLEDKNINVTDDIKSTNNAAMISKSDLKAQRRAIQEAQRLLKVNEKTQTISKDGETTKIEIPAKEQTGVGQNKPNENNENKSALKAKRRAVQEAQRLAKANAVSKVNVASKTNATTKTQPKITNENIKEPVKLKKVINIPDSIASLPASNTHKKLQLFHHLCFQYNPILSKEISLSLHSSIIRLGAQYMSHTVLGSNARCLALLSAIKHLVNDYRTPPNEEFCRSLETNLQLSMVYLQMCRPPAVSMTNALRHIKLHLTQIPNNLLDGEKKHLLLDGIDTYIRDEIGMADKAISLTVQGKICDGDVILIYGCSSIVMKILLDAHNKKKGKSFKVIVVDARPLLEGREMLRKLVQAGINCSYVLINAISFIMGKATKVLLGAHSLLANGYVMSRTGTAQIALIAQSYNKPVLVCCETYKFCERVQTDSIVHNEIGNPDQLVNINGLEDNPLNNWKSSKYVTPLNLMYDITPPDLVTAVVTELAILPCTSVPVILRIKPTEIAL